MFRDAAKARQEEIIGDRDLRLDRSKPKHVFSIAFLLQGLTLVLGKGKGKSKTSRDDVESLGDDNDDDEKVRLLSFFVSIAFILCYLLDRRGL